MKKIEYRNKELLCDEYLQIFSEYLSKMQKEWESIREKIDGFYLFPEKIEDILIARFEDLANMYSDYISMEISYENINNITKIFKYKGYWQTKISEFYRFHSEEMGINTCCYCETAYINIYKKGNGKKSHFDLDHFFPKANCPILSLSFYNLVPSCPICNERLKKNDILGDDSKEWLLLSPTSDNYAFDDAVKIHVLPKQRTYNCMRYQDNPEKFFIHFDTSMENYEKEIEMFHLNERYDFHICEALRLLDLLQNYPDTYIHTISTIINRSEESIKEDIFHQDFILHNDRVFAKLYRDLLRY